MEMDKLVGYPKQYITGYPSLLIEAKFLSLAASTSLFHLNWSKSNVMHYIQHHKSYS